MFTRLNTQTQKLSDGELFKAYGHRGDIWEIEMAKKIIGNIWTSTFNDNYKFNGIVDLNYIHELWGETFADLREDRRCNNLAMILGYIISAKTTNFSLFSKLYPNLAPQLSKAGESPSEEDKKMLQVPNNNKTDKLKIFAVIIPKATPSTVTKTGI